MPSASRPPQTPGAVESKAENVHERREARPPSTVRRSQAPSSQFAPTPRFNFASSHKTVTHETPASSSSPLATRGRPFKSQTQRDDIDEIHDEDVPVVSAGLQFHPSVEDGERDEMLLDLEEQSAVLKRRHSSPSLLPAASRKRTQAEPILLSSSPEPADFATAVSDDELEDVASPAKRPARQDAAQNTMEPPQTPVFRRVGAPRFKYGSTASTTPAQVPHSSIAGRLTHYSQIKMPTTQASLQSAASVLPLLFSPRKRGEQYISGGLAETVRDWVLEAGGKMPFTENQDINVRAVSAVGSGGAFVITGARINHNAEGTDGEQFLFIGSEDVINRSVQPGHTVSVKEGWSMTLMRPEPSDAGNSHWQVAWGPIGRIQA